MKTVRYARWGAVGLSRGIDMSKMDTHDYEGIAGEMGIAHQLVQEIEYINDEGSRCYRETPEDRWLRIREWASEKLKTPASSDPKHAPKERG